MSYRDDEFNYVKVTNEGQNPDFEFGLTQDAEFTSFSDNSNNIRDEVNDNPQSNSDDKPKDEEKEQKKQESSREDTSNKENHSSGNGGGSSGASAGGSAGAIATAAGAAVVTVSVISATIGINLFISAKCKVNKMDLTPVSLTYDLDLEEVGENEKFVIKMANDELKYEEIQDLKEGSNEGYFVNLTPANDYVVSVYNPDYVNSPIYLKTVTTPVDGEEIKERVKVTFDSDGRDGTMSSVEVQTKDLFEVPVCIYVPNNDEIFAGWKVSGRNELAVPGDKITLKDDTVLKATWEKLPTRATTTVGTSTLFRFFPPQASSEITTVENIMDIDFNVQNVYYSSPYLNFAVGGGFVSTTRPFGGVLEKIELKTGEVQEGDIDYTVVFSAEPIYEKTTASGETSTIGTYSTHTFNSPISDARYFCLSVSGNDQEASIESITFIYNVPDKSGLSFVVHIDPNGGVGTAFDYTIREDNKGQLPSVSTAGFEPQSGYEFTGWKVQGVSDLLEAGTTIGISCDITLLAQWKNLGPARNYTVTFNSNRGSSVQSQVVEEGSYVTRPDDPIREGYVFTAWYSDEELTNSYHFDEEINSNITLFAGWKPDVNFSMFINYIDTLRTSATNKISFKYTKEDINSVLTDFYLEIDGDMNTNLYVGSLSDASSNTTKAIDIDSGTATNLGTGIVNYTMRGTDSYGDSYEVATGSFSMSRSQMNYYFNAYIGGQELEADNSDTTFPVYLSGTESDGSSSSTYYIPFRLDYAYYSTSSPELYLVYSLDGTSTKNTSFYYTSPAINLNFSSTSSSSPIFDSYGQATLKTMYFADSSLNPISGTYENVNLQASDSLYVGGFSLSNMLNPTSRSIRLHACGERGTNQDNLYENYTFTTLGVNSNTFAANLTIRLLSKGGTIERTYNIDLTSALKAVATSSMSTTNANFDFFDTITQEDKSDEFIELAKRYVADAELTVSLGNEISFSCLSYESYSFR